MKHLDLFSGIGGFALAGTRVWGDQYENVGFCDYEPFCQQVLKKHFPNSKIYGDIKKLDARAITADIVTGGFPCQPFSQAGHRKGTHDDRHLWPEMLRVIREVSPRWVVAENVRGITNWDGGLVFDSIQADLEAEGYEVLPFLLPASGVEAPHERCRTWFIAFSNTNRSSGSIPILPQEGRQESESKHTSWTCKGLADTDSINGPRRNIETTERRKGARRSFGLRSSARTGETGWPVEPSVCRVAHGIPNRVDRIKSLGNAIVPQVAEQIFKAIRAYEETYG